MIPDTSDTSDTSETSESPDTRDLAPALPTEVWSRVMDYLDPWSRSVARVSRQFMAAWRAGVVGLHVQLPEGHPLAFLRQERFNRYPNLKFVILNETAIQSDFDREPGAHALALQRPGVSLRLTLWRRLSANTLLGALRDSPELAAMVSHLTFALQSHQNDILALVQALPRLLSLHINCCHSMSEGGLRQLLGRPGLQHLVLFGCKDLSGSGLQALTEPGCTVRSLGIEGTPLTNEQLLALAQAPQLEKLELAACSGLRAEGIAHLANSPSLRHLSLRRNQWLNADCLHQLGGLRQRLQRLSLSDCPRVDDTALAALQGMDQLRYLNLRGCGHVTLPALQSLASTLPALQAVTTGPTDDSEDEAAALATPVFNAQRQRVRLSEDEEPL